MLKLTSTEIKTDKNLLERKTKSMCSKNNFC